MQARIALLEGERQSFENVKLDLMRRIKMLEYALRMERSVQLCPEVRDTPLTRLFYRSKQLSQPASQTVPPSKLAAIQAQTATSTQKDDVGSHKEESGGSSPRSEGALAQLKWNIQLMSLLRLTVAGFTHSERRTIPRTVR